MPVQPPMWNCFLSCSICRKTYNLEYIPVSLSCGHTMCLICLKKLHHNICPFDQNVIALDVDKLPINVIFLSILGFDYSKLDYQSNIPEDIKTHYDAATRSLLELSLHVNNNFQDSILSKQMQRKVVAIISVPLLEPEGQIRVSRAARSLGERCIMEILIMLQPPHQTSANLWASVRARGCQFLGCSIQERILHLILAALGNGALLSRKELVNFVVLRMDKFPQASKTAIGHVVQLLYRASCFNVTKRDEESSLMQLKEEFRDYLALRKEHDAQIVVIATESGLRISPDQWSILLYGGTSHRPYMQSLCDKLQTSQSFSQAVNEFVVLLSRNGDPLNISRSVPYFKMLGDIQMSSEKVECNWEEMIETLEAVNICIQVLVELTRGQREKFLGQDVSVVSKYKTSMCRNQIVDGSCPRGIHCTFAHSQNELERFRGRQRWRTVPPSSDTRSKDRCSDFAGGRPMRVSVPVMRPSALPSSSHYHISKQSHHTSPSLTHHPGISSVFQHAANQENNTRCLPRMCSTPALTSDGTSMGDSQNYLSRNMALSTRGKSMTAQLVELNRRRESLLDHLYRPVDAKADEFEQFNDGKLDFYEDNGVIDKLQPFEGIDSDMLCCMDPSEDCADFTFSLPDIIPESDECVPVSQSMEQFEISHVPSSITEGAAGLEGAEGIVFREDNSCCPSESDDFVPLQHTMVSKYGPISRAARMNVRNSGSYHTMTVPPREPTAVTAVTPMDRGFPISTRVMSLNDHIYTQSDHAVDPHGLYVAASLPTALMRPNVFASNAPRCSEPHTLWALSNKMIVQDGGPQLRNDMERLNLQIESLQQCEEERMARELHSIELNIQETQRHVDMVS